MADKKEKIITLKPGEVWRPHQIGPKSENVLYSHLDNAILDIRRQLMGINEWAEMHDESYHLYIDGEEYAGEKIVEIDIPGENALYKFYGDLYEYRDLPSQYIIDYAERIEWDDEGNITSTIEVFKRDVPEIWKAAIDKAVTQW